MTTRQASNAYIICKLYSSYVIIALDVYFLKLCSRLTPAVFILLSFCGKTSLEETSQQQQCLFNAIGGRNHSSACLAARIDSGIAPL